MRSFEIAGRRVGEGAPVFIIAEAGVNHNGDIRLAEDLVRTASEAHVDAIKFQTFSASAVASASAPKVGYQLAGTNKAESRVEMLARLELSNEEFRRFRKLAAELSIIFLSTPHDDGSVQFLAKLGVPAMKIGSGDLTNLPMLRRVRTTGLPVMLSTGMATLVEVETPVRELARPGGGCMRDSGLSAGCQPRPRAHEPGYRSSLGDMREALGGAIAAAHFGLLVAHVHGGEISGTIDDSTRHAISKFAHLHFASTRNNAERLVRMGERPESVHMVGAPALDYFRHGTMHEKLPVCRPLALDPERP